MFAALQLADALRTMGHPATLVEKIDINSPNLHIIYGAHNHMHLPKRYIIYQTEVAGSHHFSPRYLQYIRRAVAVWDYNAANTAAYRHINQNVHIVPPWVSSTNAATNLGSSVEKDIPVLFYGWIKGSMRREYLLEETNKQLQIRNLPLIHIVTNTLGTDMWQLLRRTQVVLNLHYFHNSPLELFRITEALSHNCHIVSEGPVDVNYNNTVSFANTPISIALTIGALLASPPPSCDGYVQPSIQKPLHYLQRAVSLM